MDCESSVMIQEHARRRTCSCRELPWTGKVYARSHHGGRNGGGSTSTSIGIDERETSTG